jgi:hypothetical protein
VRQWLKKSTNVLDFQNAFSLFRIMCNKYNAGVGCQSGKHIVDQLVKNGWVKDRVKGVEVGSELYRHRLLELNSGKAGRFKDNKDEYKFEEHGKEVAHRSRGRTLSAMGKAGQGIAGRIRGISGAAKAGAKEMLRTASSNDMKMGKNMNDGSSRARGVTISKPVITGVR